MDTAAAGSRRPRRSPPARSWAILGAALLTLATSSAASGQSAETWTEFQGGPGKEGAAHGPAPAYREAWSTAIDPGGPGRRYGLSAVVTADDLSIAVGPDVVLGVDAASGEPAFSVRRALGPSVASAIADVGDSPAVVYTQGWGDGPPEPEATTTPSPSPGEGSGSSATPPELAAFDLETRDPLWPPVALDGVSRTGVTVFDGLAVAGTSAGTVQAVELETGTLSWTAELGRTPLTAIAAGDGIAIVGLQGDRDTQPALVALGDDGQERWRYEPPQSASVVSAASIADGSAYAIVTGLSDTYLVALDLADGSQRWATAITAVFDVVTPPVVGQGVVVVTDIGGHTRAVDAADGTERWDFALNAPVVRSGPVLVGSYVLVPSTEGELGAIDVASGELVFRRPPDGSPLRFLSVADDRIVGVRAGAEAGLVAFEHDPDLALVQEASPTTLAVGTMVTAMAAGAAIVVALTLLLGRLLDARGRPAPIGRDDGSGLDESAGPPPHDPWEPEGSDT